MDSPYFFFAFSALLSIGLGYPSLLAARRLNLMDIPGTASHKAHARPTPLAGGLLMAATWAVMAVIFRAYIPRDIAGVMTGALVIFLFGLWDDKKGLSAAPKLVGQFIAALILIAFHVQVNFIGTMTFTTEFPAWLRDALNIAITLFWVIGITNAVNMIDSMDGIVAGLGVIVSACFVVATDLSNQIVLTLWAAALLGICIGLYFWNRMPAKFFLGDSGAQTLGFMLASFGMMYNPRNFHPESSWIVPIMLLSVPIFDTTLVVVSRLRRGQSVKSGRLDHTYHRLVALGLAPNQAVLLTHSVVLGVSCLAFLTLYLPPSLALAFFSAIIVCGIVCMAWLERKPALDEQNGQNDDDE